MAFVDEVVDGKELDGSDAELFEVVDAGIAGETGVGAAQLFRNHGVPDGVAADIDLVDDGVRERRVGGAVVLPVEVPAIDDDGFGNARSGVFVVPLKVVAGGDVVGKDRRLPVDVTGDGLGVGIDEELGLVEAVALLRGPGPVDTIAVSLPGFDVADEAVPDEGGVLTQLHAVDLGAFLVEEADKDGGGVFGVEGEVGAFGVGRGSERVGSSGQEGAFHASHFGGEIRFAMYAA